MCTRPSACRHSRDTKVRSTPCDSMSRSLCLDPTTELSACGISTPPCRMSFTYGKETACLSLASSVCVFVERVKRRFFGARTASYMRSFMYTIPVYIVNNGMKIEKKKKKKKKKYSALI
eukprot:Opistho-2@37190